MLWDVFDFVAGMIELCGDFVIEFIVRLVRAPKSVSCNETA